MTTQWLCGDALECLRTLPDESISCVVTSPPYWGLRDYGVAGQIGLERTPEEYVARLAEVFREVRRILQPDGTFWLNIGDSYAASGGHTKAGESGFLSKMPDQALARTFAPQKVPCGYKAKDLIGIPWMVAFALRADGWWLRQDIVWAKPNPMPESVRDRCTRSHEYIFLLTKNAKYWYDADAISEPLTRPDEGTRKTPAKFGGADKHVEGCKQNRLHSGNEYLGTPTGTRNKRSVWTVTPKPFAEAHFATFPPELPELCIKAGCPPGGVVLDPFAGAGTTGMVARRLVRSFIGIELNAKYVEMAKRRIERDVK